MKLNWKKLTCSALFVLSLSMLAQAQQTQETPAAMSLWQTRRTLPDDTKYLQWRRGEIQPASFRFTAESIEFDLVRPKGETEHFMLDLRTFEAVSIKCNSQGKHVVACLLMDAAGRKRPSIFEAAWHEGSIWTAKCPDECVNAARSFAAALNRLRTFATDTTSPLRTFPQRASAWRVLATKPALSHEVRLLRLAAEDAVKNRKPKDALNCYEMGVENDPTWAQGWFNAAIIAGQLGYYEDAAEHMQCYLELVPDAQDAQSARDQMDLWLFKARQVAPGQSAKQTNSN